MGRTIISADGRFEWDEEKALINLKKHGLAFGEILSVFDDPNSLEFMMISIRLIPKNGYRELGYYKAFWFCIHVIRNEVSGQGFILSEKPGQERRQCTMNGSKILSPERIAEIKAFKDVDISDCPELTEEELKRMRPRRPEYFRPIKKAVQIRLDADDTGAIAPI